MINITLFNSEKLDKCKIILKIRKENNLRLSDRIVPDTADNDHGYHITCYRRFTALSENHRKSNDKIENKVLRSDTSLHGIKLTVCIFPKKYLFCGMEKKKSKRSRASLCKC